MHWVLEAAERIFVSLTGHTRYDRDLSLTRERAAHFQLVQQGYSTREAAWIVDLPEELAQLAIELLALPRGSEAGLVQEFGALLHEVSETASSVGDRYLRGPFGSRRPDAEGSSAGVTSIVTDCRTAPCAAVDGDHMPAASSLRRDEILARTSVSVISEFRRCSARQGKWVTKQRADHPCVLPGDSAWINDARYVQDILASLAAAAAVAHDYGHPEEYVLPHLPFQVAADTIGQIRSDMSPARHDAVYLMALPAFQLEAQWQVLGVLRSARDAARTPPRSWTSYATTQCWL